MSFAHKRVILDTNILISSAINPDSPAGLAYQYAVAYYDLFTSEETIAELEAVL